MFTIIEVKKSQKLWLTHFIKPEPKLTKIAVKDALPFFKIDVEDTRKIPWDDIFYMARRCSDEIIISDNINLPDDIKINKFTPHKLPLILLFNSVMKILKIYKNNNLRIGINDPNGAVCNRIKKLIPFSQEIIVATENKGYQKVANELMNEFGFNIVLSEKISSIVKSDIIISQKAITEKRCFSTDKNGFDEVVLFSDFKLLPIYFQKLPLGISEEVFSSALYELCHAKRIGEQCYRTIEVNGKLYIDYESKLASFSN